MRLVPQPSGTCEAARPPTRSSPSSLSPFRWRKSRASSRTTSASVEGADSTRAHAKSLSCFNSLAHPIRMDTHGTLAQMIPLTMIPPCPGRKSPYRPSSGVLVLVRPGPTVVVLLLLRLLTMTLLLLLLMLLRYVRRADAPLLRLPPPRRSFISSSRLILLFISSLSCALLLLSLPSSGRGVPASGGSPSPQH